MRQFVVGAVLRDINLDADSYSSFIDLQDKLHGGIGRKRTLASIGTHDLDKIKAPVRYRAIPPSEIVFKPLNLTKELTALEQMQLYENNYLKEYLPIIRNEERYPVIQDADGIILSMPPIINSDHSKITLQTRNIFIEVTGTDMKKLEIVLDTIVTMFSQYCKQPYLLVPFILQRFFETFILCFSVDPVEILYPNGKSFIYPVGMCPQYFI